MSDIGQIHFIGGHDSQKAKRLGMALGAMIAMQPVVAQAQEKPSLEKPDASSMQETSLDRFLSQPIIQEALQKSAPERAAQQSAWDKQRAEKQQENEKYKRVSEQIYQEQRTVQEALWEKERVERRQQDEKLQRISEQMFQEKMQQERQKLGIDAQSREPLLPENKQSIEIKKFSVLENLNNDSTNGTLTFFSTNGLKIGNTTINNKTITYTQTQNPSMDR